MAEGDREQLLLGLKDPGVREAAEGLRQRGGLLETLRFGAQLARAAGDDEEADALEEEANGFDDDDDDQLPQHRFVLAFATPFPLRSLDTGLLDPEDVFLANADKFARVRFGLRESAERLEEAMDEVAAGGVLAIRVPAREVAGEGAEIPEDAEVHLYVLARELRGVVEGIKARVHTAIIERLARAVDDP